jgi:hypothetical protein
MPRQVPKIGDIFLIPLSDGSHSVGQVVETLGLPLNSIACAFFDIRGKGADYVGYVEQSQLTEGNVVSCQFVTREQINKGVWKRVANAIPNIPQSMYPYRDTQAKEWVGAKVIGSGVLKGFLEAYYGLESWTGMRDPNYFDRLLAPGKKGPKCV